MQRRFGGAHILLAAIALGAQTNARALVQPNQAPPSTPITLGRGGTGAAGDGRAAGVGPEDY